MGVWEDMQTDRRELTPETLPVYTWWVFDSDAYGVDLLRKQQLDLLSDIFEKLGVYPFKDMEGNPVIFPARFEFPKYEKDYQFPQAIFLGGLVLGFIDFLSGIPIECIEMLVLIDENDDPSKVASLPSEGGAAAPVPDEFFAGYDDDKILLNMLYLAADRAEFLADNLEGEPDVETHFWFRVNLPGETPPKYPTPGGFLGMGVRLMPDEPWGEQDSSPFFYSGAYCDTCYYTRGRIEEIILNEETGLTTYKVKWHDGKVYEVCASDFNEYQVGDHVAILKDVSTEKTSQLWKDEEQKAWGDNWVLAPITFYQTAQEG